LGERRIGMQKKYNIKFLTLVWLGLLSIMVFHITWAQSIESPGQQFINIVDQMDVEHNWLPKEGIDWKTGKFDPNERAMSSHCSGFVAAVCNNFNIYILRPPDHPQEYLANAQFDWLRDHGATYGWMLVNTPDKAQQLANQGLLVVVTYKNPQYHKAGHIAIVRPYEKNEELIHEEGPQIIQSGMQNYSSTSLKIGFKHHPDAWVSDTDYQVQFYAHKIPE